MSDTEKQIDDEKGDEVLKRMLKTPPDPKNPPKPKPGRKPIAPDGSMDTPGAPGDY